MRLRMLLALAGCWAALAAGCSSSKGARSGGKVTGTVTLNDKPVSGAKIIFTDGKGGKMVSGPTAVSDADGKYVLVGVPPGSYKIVVYKLAAKPGAKLPEADDGELDLEQIEASGIGTHALPRKYSNPTTTTLAESVDAGTTTIDLKLTGK